MSIRFWYNKCLYPKTITLGINLCIEQRAWVLIVPLFVKFLVQSRKLPLSITSLFRGKLHVNSGQGNEFT